MRILVVSNFYPPAHFGGYELDCAQVVDGLKGQHDVLVLTSRYRSREVHPEPGILRVLPFGRHRRRDLACAPVRSIVGVRRASRVAEEFDPDVVFIWNGTQIPQAVLWALGRLGTPVAYRVCDHGLGQLYRTDDFLQFLSPGWTGAKGIWSAGMRIVNRHRNLRIDLDARSPAAVAWVSHTLRDITPIPSVEPTLERVIYIGVPAPEAAHPVVRDGLTIGFVGRISPEKAPDVAIKALHRLRTRHGLDVAMVIVGTGNAAYLDELQGLVRSLLLEEHVRVLGHLDRSRVMELMAGLAALVVPSRWQEPSGTVASEAAAVGTPVVAARSGGIPEYLPEGEAALFFDIDDVEGCARALVETLQDEEETRRRTARARARARALLTTDAEIETMEEFLLEVVGQSG